MDERIERIRAYLHHPVFSIGAADFDLDSIEADLAELTAVKAQLESVTKQRDTKAAVIRDYIEDEDAARELLRPYLTEFELEGDSYGVPGFVQWIETLIEKYKSVTHERNVALRAVEVMYRQFDAGTDCFEECIEDYKKWKGCNCVRAALAMAEAELASEATT